MHVFGFLGGREVKKAGVVNSGLQDRESQAPSSNRICCLMLTRPERTALCWVQRFITAFGGDPSKVTMYVAWLAVLDA